MRAHPAAFPQSVARGRQPSLLIEEPDREDHDRGENGHRSGSGDDSTTANDHSSAILSIGGSEVWCDNERHVAGRRLSRSRARGRRRYAWRQAYEAYSSVDR